MLANRSDKLRPALRLTAAVVILVALIRVVGAREVTSSLLDLKVWYLPIAFLMLLLDSAIRSLNWRRLLRTRHPDLRVSPVLHSYLYGGVLSLFVPSSVGSDVARVTILGYRTEIRVAELASSIVVINAVGLWALCCIALVQSVRLRVTGVALPVLDPVMALSALGVLVLTTVFVAAPYASGIPPRGRGIMRPISKLLRSVAAYASEHRALSVVALLAMASFLMHVTLVYLLAAALTLDLAFQHIALLLPIVLVSRLVPLSVAGLGAEQGVFIILFGGVGLGAPDAVALSLATSATRLAFWGLCGIGYLSASGVDALRAVTRPGAGAGSNPPECAGVEKAIPPDRLTNTLNHR